MLKDGDWVVVKVGGVPFMEKPPLYQWVAVLTARLFSPWLPLHDAARLASGVFLAIAVGAVAFASRVLWGRGRGRVGALMALSALGLLVNGQMMLSDLPLMAGFALALAGFAGCRRNRPWGGIVLGIGVGFGFLGKGVLAPAVLGVAALALPAFFAEWRTRRYACALGAAFAAALPFLLVWPVALWHRSPALFMAWFWENNVGRYLGFSVAHLGAASERGFWIETWPWFLFPLWVFVGAGLLRDRSRLLSHPAGQIGLVVSACIAIVLATSASARAIYALSMIPSLALVAAGCVRGAGARPGRWPFVGDVLFAGVMAMVVWYVWASLAFTARAPDWPWLTQHFPAEFALGIEPFRLALAA
ncbi:MAG TPA: glycosyltransferase family 39 protein, partial [Usitatibacter sp.]